MSHCIAPVYMPHLLQPVLQHLLSLATYSSSSPVIATTSPPSFCHCNVSTLICHCNIERPPPLPPLHLAPLHPHPLFAIAILLILTCHCNNIPAPFLPLQHISPSSVIATLNAPCPHHTVLAPFHTCQSLSPCIYCSIILV